MWRSPIYTPSMKQTILQHQKDTLVDLFSTPNADIRLCTFKSDDIKNINWADSRLRLVSDRYLIIRESNNQRAGYHYHAIARFVREPKKIWYRKGIHTDIRKIDKYELQVGDTPPERMDFSRKELTTTLCPEEITEEIMEKQKEENDLKKLVRNRRRYQHVSRVISYITKELQVQQQYVTYILFHSKRQQKM